MKGKRTKADARNRRENILRTAARLFVAQGYENTGMRQIAEEANVALSLASYHFGSKRELGKRLILWHLRTLQQYVLRYTEEDERLFAATLLRLNYRLMNTERMAQFYRDMLLNDIYLEALISGNVELEKQRTLSKAQMYWVISDSYLPVSMERALILCPFLDLLGIDVPDFIIKHSVYYHSKGGEILHDPDWYVEQSRYITQTILDKHPELYALFENLQDCEDAYL